ncbi:MAG: hypothetical protein GF350_03125 [Chitinivibrionales bacterium]|nr:hypothetical protein [Chitinivibrionales bacterium]
MTLRTIRPALFSLISACLLSGCSVKGTIFNHADFAVEARSMKLADAPALKVLQGETVRHIKLNEVDQLSIDASETRQFQRDLYYLVTRISLKNGASIESSTTSSPGISEEKAYICIAHSITGKTEDGSFEISLSDVAKIIVE